MSEKRFTLYSATYLLLIKEGKILLLRRFNTGWQDGNYSLVAGHLDGEESVTKTMAREAEEEAGIIIKPVDLIVVHTMHRNAEDREYIDFFLIANKWEGEPKIMETDKCDDLNWFPLDSLPQNLLPYVREAIKNYKNRITFSEFGWE
jgi:ADP-ribose pyrophosphatase YjhB (NUDIX family)